MPIFEPTAIAQVALHRVGNKATDEGYVLANSLLELDDALQEVLTHYFITPFKADEYYNLYDLDGEPNEVFACVQAIFDDSDSLLERSRQLAERLYEASVHSNIKAGDFFVVYFSDCLLNGEKTDAVGLFKAENRDHYLKVLRDEEHWSREEDDKHATADFRVDIDKGININKLDKGAIVFNSEKEKGYVVSVVDATNRGSDAIYWKDNFLQIKQRQDEYYNTHQVMQAYKTFVTEELPQEYEMSKADQADLLNRSVNFFKQNDNFDMGDFARDVLAEPEVIDKFAQFKQHYEQENDVEIPEQFDISESAVKKQARVFKSVIKLDKNFHIYVHGNRQLIEQGEDEKGKYYKVYYKEES